MSKKKDTIALYRIGVRDTWTETPDDFDDEVLTIAEEFASGALEPDTFEVIEVEVKRRTLVTGAMTVTVKVKK
jgi:hypothetical protein